MVFEGATGFVFSENYQVMGLPQFSPRNRRRTLPPDRFKETIEDKNRVAFVISCESCLFEVPVLPLSIGPPAKPDNMIFPEHPRGDTVPPLCLGSWS